MLSLSIEMFDYNGTRGTKNKDVLKPAGVRPAIFFSLFFPLKFSFY